MPYRDDPVPLDGIVGFTVEVPVFRLPLPPFAAGGATPEPFLIPVGELIPVVLPFVVMLEEPLLGIPVPLPLPIPEPLIPPAPAAPVEAPPADPPPLLCAKAEGPATRVAAKTRTLSVFI